jgi:hypothetical protein
MGAVKTRDIAEVWPWTEDGKGLRGRCWNVWTRDTGWYLHLTRRARTRGNIRSGAAGGAGVRSRVTLLRLPGAEDRA